MYSIELRILALFNGLAGQWPWFDAVAGSFTKASPFIFMLIFGMCFFWPSARQQEMRRNVLYAGLSGVAAVVLSLVIVALFYRPRPFVALPPDQIRQIISHVADSSFPSNHTFGSAALAAGMWRAPSRIARWTTLGIAALVGLSRLVVGVHWPSDVVLSFVMGILMAYAVFAAAPIVGPVVDSGLGIVSKAEGFVVGAVNRKVLYKRSQR